MQPIQRTDSFILLSSITGAIGRLFSYAYWLIATLVIAQIFLMILSEFFPQITFYLHSFSSQFVYVNVVSVVLFCFAIYLYEGLAYSSILSDHFRWLSVLCILLIFSPPFILLAGMTYSLTVQTVTKIVFLGLLLLSFILPGLPGKLGSKEKFLSVLHDHFRFLLRDAWSESGPHLREIDLDKIERQKKRVPIYHDATKLAKFQKSLSSPELDGAAVLDLLKDWTFPKKIQVLDIGGGDGALTATILKGMQDLGVEITEILMIDPIDWSSSYKAALDHVVKEQVINIRTEQFDPSLLRYEFDLIIASHSLYHACDLRENDTGKILNELINPLLSRLKSNGRLVLIMASQRGRSYRFKATVLHSYYGQTVNDSNAEVIAEALANLQVKRVTIDNVFDLSQSLNKYADGEENDILDWLGYFLRLDVSSMNLVERATLVEILKYHTELLDELHEEEITRFTNLSAIHLTRQSIILRHKTIAFAVPAISLNGKTT